MPVPGPLELIIILIVALVVFGPKRLPELGKSLGSGMREFKDSISGNSSPDKSSDSQPELPTSNVAQATDADAAEKHRS